MNRLDLAQKEYDKAKAWAEDDLLLQLIEATLGLASGANKYANPHSFWNEQAHNPSLTSSHLVAANGVTHLLRGELPEAHANFIEALKLNPANPDALAGKATSEWLNGDAAKSEATFTYVYSLRHPEKLFTDPCVGSCKKRVLSIRWLTMLKRRASFSTRYYQNILFHL